MTSLELKNVKISNIQPSEKREHPAALYPSVLDLFALDVYTSFVLFYKPNQEQSDPGNLVSRLKESLSKVLVPYFPCAGRWVRTYDNRCRELQCTDEGVPFIEAYVDQELNVVLNNGDFQPNPQLSSYELVGLDAKGTHQDADIRMPALFIQATQFKCGGVALNVIFNHMTADGQAMLSFMTAWSQIALHGETSIVPTHDRSRIFSTEAFGKLLAASFGPPPQEDHLDSTTPESDPEKIPSPEMESLPDEMNGTIQSTEVESTNKSDDRSVQSSEILPRVDPGAVFKLPALATSKSKILHVKREVIESLKREAAKETLDVTTLDLITAHIWRSLYNLPDTKKKIFGASMSTYVEGRRRFHGPLPDRYFGNVIILASTPPISASQMSSYSHPFAASVVHNTVQALNASTWKDSLVDTVKALGSFNSLNYNQVHMTSWQRFPVYDLSFDSGFGSPIYACWNFCGAYLPSGIVIVMPPPPKQSTDIIASVQLLIDESNGTAEALYSDPEFLAFFNSSDLEF